MTTLPIEPNVFWGFVTLAGVSLAVFLVATVLNSFVRPPLNPFRHLKEWLGWEGVSDGLLLILLLLWTCLFLVLLFGLVVLIWDMIWAVMPNSSEDWRDFRFALVRVAGLTATLGAVVALPFTVIRVILNRKATDIAEASLLNEKINAATEDLHAMRVVTRWYQAVGERPVAREVHEADVVRRIGGIRRLSELASENPELAPRVFSLISVYLRQVSQEDGDQRL